MTDRSIVDQALNRWGFYNDPVLSGDGSQYLMQDFSTLGEVNSGSVLPRASEAFSSDPRQDPVPDYKPLLTGRAVLQWMEES